ncbi:hypothetical protein V7S43_009315 [Phytophthora oleae]|uniref:Uncharacterized protein n=1 Tax=Phytophthora oleae TaxID=2107226 RepID=A0ABD3FHY1_9STRA
MLFLKWLTRDEDSDDDEDVVDNLLENLGSREQSRNEVQDEEQWVNKRVVYAACGHGELQGEDDAKKDERLRVSCCLMAIRQPVYPDPAKCGRSERRLAASTTERRRSGRAKLQGAQGGHE